MKIHPISLHRWYWNARTHTAKEPHHVYSDRSISTAAWRCSHENRNDSTPLPILVPSFSVVSTFAGVLHRALPHQNTLLVAELSFRLLTIPMGAELYRATLPRPDSLAACPIESCDGYIGKTVKPYYDEIHFPAVYCVVSSQLEAYRIYVALTLYRKYWTSQHGCPKYSEKYKTLLMLLFSCRFLRNALLVMLASAQFSQNTNTTNHFQETYTILFWSSRWRTHRAHTTIVQQ